jgi:hypothetical protein
MRAGLAAGILKHPVYGQAQAKKSRGAFVNSHNEVASHYDAGQQGFTTEDILWAAGIWSVILTLSPVIVFYMLMVA